MEAFLCIQNSILSAFKTCLTKAAKVDLKEIGSFVTFEILPESFT